MAAAAGGGDVDMAHGRLGIVVRENLVDVSVAVFACGRRGSGGGWFGMKTVRIGQLCISVAVGTRNLFRRGFVDQAFYIFMAIDAGEHGAVDGMLQLFRIDEQADLVSVLIGCQGGIGVAGEAVFVLQLMFGASCKAPAEQNEERREQDSAREFHASRRRQAEKYYRDRSHEVREMRGLAQQKRPQGLKPTLVLQALCGG